MPGDLIDPEEVAELRRIITGRSSHCAFQWYKGVFPDHLAPKRVHEHKKPLWRDHWKISAVPKGETRTKGK
jgi:hypothetical protein